MYNRVTLAGRLGKDPIFSMTPAGKAVAKFTLATSEYSAKGGEHTEWHTIIAWERTAEFCEKHLKKGDQAIIEGRIASREYVDKEGHKRQVYEIIASSVKKIFTKREETKPPVLEDQLKPIIPTAQWDDIPF